MTSEGAAVDATATVPRQSLRADASRNRERIIDAARGAILEFGPDVPLDAIAHRAGVGNATLYRNFADRGELVYEVALASMARITEEAEAALAVAEESDPFEALRGFVHKAAAERVGSLCSLLSRNFDKNALEVVQARERLERAIGELMERARRTGQLRPDVAIGDLMIAITQLSRPLAGTACSQLDGFVRRHLELFVDGLHSPARSTLPGVAITLEDLEHRDT